MHSTFPVAVHVFLLRGEEVLLLRDSNTGYEDGKLSVVAGHVEPGETVTQAAVRETREEVGLELSRERLRVVGVMHRRSKNERVDFFLATGSAARSPKTASPSGAPNSCGPDSQASPGTNGQIAVVRRHVVRSAAREGSQHGPYRKSRIKALGCRCACLL